MSLNYNVSVLNQRLQVVANNIDAGGVHGFIRLGTFGMAQTVGLVPLGFPCGTVSAGVLTFANLPLAAPLTFISATIASATVEDSNGVIVASGLTVGNSTSFDIVMIQTVVSSGQSVALTYATITGN